MVVQMLIYIDDDLRGKLNFVMFEYTTEKNNKDQKAAMSMHLTSRDKDDVIKSLNRSNNTAAFNKLKVLMEQ
jgi:hypothetical protein